MQKQQSKVNIEDKNITKSNVFMKKCYKQDSQKQKFHQQQNEQKQELIQNMDLARISLTTSLSYSSQQTNLNTQLKKLQNFSCFLTELFLSLQLLKQHQTILQLQDKLQLSLNKFNEMKDSGEWKNLKEYIQRYFFKKQLFSQKKNIMNSQKSLRSWKRKTQEISVENMVLNKQKIEKQLKKNLNILCQGQYFDKLCFNKTKIERVKVYFSCDFQFLAYQADKKEPKIFLLRQISGISRGISSKNMKNYMGTNFNVDQSLALTFILPQRTLDLISETTQKREQFVNAFKYVKKFI